MFQVNIIEYEDNGDAASDIEELLNANWEIAHEHVYEVHLNNDTYTRRVIRWERNIDLADDGGTFVTISLSGSPEQVEAAAKSLADNLAAERIRSGYRLSPVSRDDHSSQG